MVRLLKFTGERIVPGATNCEPTFARKMYQEHILRYEFVADLAKDRDILDVGCGVGYGSRHLAIHGAKSVLGIDISEAAIDHAKSQYAHEKVIFRSVAAQKFTSEATFDLVTCFEMIEHIVEQDAVLDMIRSCLKETGVLAISTPRPDAEMRSDYHEKELELDEFLSMLKTRFRHVSTYSERNYFSSLICNAVPAQVDKILAITDCFGIAKSDYFIVLATDGDPSVIEGRSPVLVLNDDNYVRNLEKDVGVLKCAEGNLQQRVLDLETEKQSRLQEANEVEAGPSPTELLAKLAESSAALAGAQTLAASYLAEMETLRLLHASALATANAAQEALTERGKAIAELRHRAEQAEAHHAHELGQAQMLHKVLQEHSDALSAALERADRAELLHAHELSQAQMLNKALQEHSDALNAALERADRAELLHAHELNQATRLHLALQEHSDELDAARHRADQSSLERQNEAAEAVRRETQLSLEIEQLRNALEQAGAELIELRTPWRQLVRRLASHARANTKSGVNA